MSDTTSFLGGAALAGLAALVVMRGGLTIGSPSMPSQQSFQLPQLSLGQGVNPATGQAIPAVPTPAAVAVPGRTPYEDAKLDVKVESLKGQIEQLQLQVRSQQTVIDTMTTQVRTGALSAAAPQPSVIPQPTAPIVSPSDQAATSMLSGLPWALGGMMLTFGGGIALVGMFVLLSRQNRSGRTIEVIHDDYPAYLPQTVQAASRRRVQVIPPRRAIRRVEVEEE
jgi:hypothetical protein